MLSVKKCSEILNEGKVVFTDEEVGRIKDLFYELAEMDVDHYFRVQQEKILKDEESNINGKSKFRRTG